MARRVLAPVGGVVFVLLLAASSLAAQAASNPRPGACSTGLASIPAERHQQAEDFLERVKSGPFYKELVRRRGQPSACKLAIDGDSFTLSYGFRGDASLEAKTNPAIEYSQQKMEFRGLSRAQAMVLLKAAEKNAWGAKGCGIRWQRPDEETPGDEAGSREVVYRGDSCNCQGRLVYKKNVVVALVSSSAC